MSQTYDGYFAVDKRGLRKIAYRRGSGWIVRELFQNALDENVTRVEMVLEPVPDRPMAKLRIEDDSPDGFRDLDHAYTLFAESYKKADPSKRGRFNLGEKFVLAVCERAVISSTTGTVEFTEDGRRIVRKRKKRPRGSVFEGILYMTRYHPAESRNAASMVIVATGVKVVFNGEVLQPREPIHSFEATLDTEVADDEGFLRKSRRKTTICVFEPFPDETATLYEMGLPVVESGDRWHIHVGQKVPLTMDRENVPPGFLAGLRTCVLNEMHQHLDQDDANSDWVRQATSDSRCSEQAITRALDLRFGEDRVSFDPSDLEANHRAVAEGYTVVHGSQMSKTEWTNAREAEAIVPAGKKFPTPKPYSDDPNAPREELIPPDKWTEGMRLVAEYAKALAEKLLNAHIKVHIAVEGAFKAVYGPGRLVFNNAACGPAFFENGITEEVDDLILHEFGHHYESNHLSESYYRALTRLGAKLKALARKEPEFFDQFDAARSRR